ncbi:hypothetical protein CS542_02280 [Pedobacter sp. IW39]|nr:hypothetical protein CS542_02280 [Pedobacter sp. IW39]
MNFSAFFKTVPRIQFKSSILISDETICNPAVYRPDAGSCQCLQPKSHSGKNVSVETILKAIEKQSDYLFYMIILKLPELPEFLILIRYDRIGAEACLKITLTYKIFKTLYSKESTVN